MGPAEEGVSIEVAEKRVDDLGSDWGNPRGGIGGAVL